MLNRIARLIRHRWMDEAHRVVTPDMLERLKQRVAASENQHTGEICICIEGGLPNSYLLQPDALDALSRKRALTQFGKLGIWDTEHNNGVLIYLLLAERHIELVPYLRADTATEAAVCHQFDMAMVQRLALALRDGKFEDGLSLAVADVSAVLAAHFPPTAGHVKRNELPDQPVLA